MPRIPLPRQTDAVRRQAAQLTLVRRRAQPVAAYIIRLTLTAVFAYLLALYLTPHETTGKDPVAPSGAHSGRPAHSRRPAHSGQI